jgi:glutaredoxin-related protein
MNELTRESYVESELKKWKESYIIRLEQEFSIKAMLELQYQYNNTPDEHVKAKRDLIETITKINRDLRLKPVINKDKFKVLVIVNHDYEAVNIYNMFQKMLVDMIPFDDIQIASSGRVSIPKISTKNFDIVIDKSNLSLLHGKKADYIVNLSGNSEIDKLFRDQNKL